MKILLAHNFYGSSAPSGENTVFLAERELLRGHGHTVIEFTRNSDEIRSSGIRGAIKGAVSTPWNPFSAHALYKVLQQEKPDIMHVHNTFPLLSPSIFHTANRLNTATVLTLHNYRIFCAAGIPMRKGNPCTKCLDTRSAIPSLKYACYRNSKLATLPLATMISLHKRIHTWHKDVDAFIALTGFQKDKMAGAGLHAERIHIKPHFYSDPPSPCAWTERKSKVVFVGRLGFEKGVHLLIEAWKKWGGTAPSLDLIGDGPEKSRLKNSVEKSGLSGKVHFRGQLAFPEVQKRLSQSKLLILPSLCFEGFPMVIRESFALGVPVAASRLGSMPCLIENGKNGVLFEPGDAENLCQVVQDLWTQPDKLAAMGQAARSEFEEKYTAEVNHKMLMEIYEAAIKKTS